jgi:peptide/nickel transport system substrate-binding protein
LIQRKWRAAAVVGALALTMAACGGDDEKTPTGGGTGTGTAAGKKGGTLTFGTSADPVTLDGAYVSDGESLRVIDQIFEGLVTTKLGGTEIEPRLAKDWSASDDGTAWTFNLQSGVKFHDGTDFNAKAVCANFDRWYNFKGLQQSESVSYYWNTVFGGFSDGKKPSLYKSCEAPSDTQVVINLTSPSASFLAGLALANFSIASPDALTKYKADQVGGNEEKPEFNSEFGSKFPIGTGPFKLESWTPGDRLVMARNDNYWNKDGIAKLDKVIFRPIADGPARRQALESGGIDGYDLVEPSDLEPLKSKGFQIIERPAFNVGYMGFQSDKPPLDKKEVRQAIAHAINREELVRQNYPPGAEVAKEFMPPLLFGYADDVPTYDYDPEKAKELLKTAGVTNPAVEFWYPSNVSRPYMPAPEKNFTLMKADLEAVGFKVTAKSAPWNPDYLSATSAGKTQIYLLGWTGDFGDPDNFLGTFFRTKQPAWGFDNADIRNKLEEGRTETDEAKRTAIYQEANKMIMDFLPGLPYVHTKPALAFKKNVKGYVASPVSLEPFSILSLE